ncbi:MAG: YbgA family protein, partial [Thermodesulfobacteriota bacterium]
RKAIVSFHTRHKLLILSHSEKHYRSMGKLVAETRALPLEVLFKEYEKQMMGALSLKSTIRKNANVLQHMMGYFKEHLTSDEKQEILEVISEYRSEFIPLIVPVTLMKHYTRKYKQAYLNEQVYLNPHPAELKLRNHV